MRPTGPTGRRIIFFSWKGGVGTSTIATSVALLLAQQRGTPVGLLDLALDQGQAEVLLDVVPRADLGTMAQNRVDPTSLDPERIQSYLTPHASGVALLAAPRQPEDAERVTADLAAGALRAMASGFGCVVVDTPSAFTDPVLAAVEQADMVVLVATPDLSGVKATAATLRISWKLGLPAERLSIVLNAAYGEPVIPQGAFEEAVGSPVFTLIPYEPAFAQALNSGQPLVLRPDRRPRPAVAALTALANRVGASPAR